MVDSGMKSIASVSFPFPSNHQPLSALFQQHAPCLLSWIPAPPPPQVCGMAGLEDMVMKHVGNILFGF